MILQYQMRGLLEMDGPCVEISYATHKPPLQEVWNDNYTNYHHKMDMHGVLMHGDLSNAYGLFKNGLQQIQTQNYLARMS